MSCKFIERHSVEHIGTFVVLQNEAAGFRHIKHLYYKKYCNINIPLNKCITIHICRFHNFPRS